MIYFPTENKIVNIISTDCYLMQVVPCVFILCFVIFSLSLHFSHHAIRLLSVEYIYKFESFWVVDIKQKENMSAAFDESHTSRTGNHLHNRFALNCNGSVILIRCWKFEIFTIEPNAIFQSSKRFHSQNATSLFSRSFARSLEFLVRHFNHKFL